MRYDRIIWGILLLFVGGVLLLSNFNVIGFYWPSIFKYWPVAFIIIGLTLVFNRNGSQLGSKISLGVLMLCLAIFFFSGLESFRGKKIIKNNIIESENDFKPQELIEPFALSDSAKLTTLNIKDGGSSYELVASTSALFEAFAIGHPISNPFGLSRISTDSTTVLVLKRKNGNVKRWDFKDTDNRLDLKLNTTPVWKLNLDMGVSKVDFDLSAYKIRTINFNGGASEFDVKIGDLLPVTDVEVNSGVAEINIEVPETSGCQITTNAGLSTKDFEGFTKVSDRVYQTANFKTATKKIFINIRGGLSTFEVNRY